MLTILYVNYDSPQLTPQITTNAPLVHHSWVVLPRIPPKSSKNKPTKAPYGDGSKPWYLVNPKIAGKWMFIPLKMVSIGIDP
jgi:hypothetical protein